MSGLLAACSAGLPMGTASAEPPSQVAKKSTPARHIFASRHYHIHTDLTREQTVPFGRHMDAVYDAYLRRFEGFTAQRHDPMPLYLFATEAEYQSFLTDLGIRGKHSGGMFFVNHR
ncbi:MAG: hypothetical protein AAF916_11740, partial [Planctomycetota bacterium]